MKARTARRIVVLGMVSKMPVPGVVWQTLHYLVGLDRLGYDVWYVEAHARTPSMFVGDSTDAGSRAAATFIDRLLAPYGLAGKWAFHALHHDGACYGMRPSELERLYASADLILNLHGGTRPRDEHVATGRLAYVGTDPVQLEVELWQKKAESEAFLDAHAISFTFGESYGRADSLVPVTDRAELIPTRQPVVLDFWSDRPADRGVYTTVANWRQPFRVLRYLGEEYHWSKDREFEKVLDLPGRTSARFELALSSFEAADRVRLEAHGWRVGEAVDLVDDPGEYRDYLLTSRGEFTVAKDQNVRLRSGWFSDRSATYLAAGRPVITQETGFSDHLPTGGGLFGFSTLDEAVDAVDTIERDYAAACRAAEDVARGWFDYRVVLPPMLAAAGIEGPRAPVPAGVGAESLPDTLDLEPRSRRPLRLADETVRAVSAREAPEVCPPVERVRWGRGTGATSIVVVTHDGLLFTRLCLEEMLGAAADHAFEVVVVDNASSDGTPEYLRRLAAADPRVRLVLNPANEGFAAACNQGARIAVGDTLVFLNPDTLPVGDWLPRLVAHLSDEGVGAVNPVTNRIGTEAEVADAPRTLGEVRRTSERRAAAGAAARDADMLAFFCLAIRREVWDEVGELDESFGIGLFEDDDYSERLRAAGYRLLCAEDVYVHHFGEAAFGELVPDGRYAELFEENRRRFEAKWERAWARPGCAVPDGYGSLVTEVRDTAGRLGADARVAVVSRGDPELVALDGPTGEHFPQDERGVWAGHYPEDGARAVAHLESLRRRGVTHFLLPATGAWWLDHYPELDRYLAAHGSTIARNERLWLVEFGPLEAGATAARPGPVLDEPRPLFVIGSPRSGTSVLTWCLGQHPNLYPLEETVWFGRFHEGLDGAFELGSSRGDRSHLSAEGVARSTFFRAFGRTVHELVMDHRRRPDAPVAPGTAFARMRHPDDPKARWVDGTPENSFFVNRLVELFPEARFIHLLREPDAVARSLMGFDRIGGRRHGVDEAYARWFRNVRACADAERDLGPDRVLRVLHRDLVNAPDMLLRSCLEFAGEAYTPDCLLPLGERINSSGAGRPSEVPPPDDPGLLARVRSLEEQLFTMEVAS